MPSTPLREIRAVDANRPSVPGEHWMTFAAGVALWIATRKNPSLAVRLIAGVAGGLLVARAASGRDVPQALQRWIPYASDRG